MQIEELHLKAFGPFTDCTISLAPGLNILYGPNEAGKSSTLRAIDALLFGVPSRTADDFVHDYRQMRVGGVLVRQDGQRLACVRRKGNKHTLRDADDAEPLDERIMEQFLGSVDQDFFRSVFGIDHQRLREGGVEVVRGEGRIGELLFAAGGVAHLRALQQTLEEEAGALFKPRAKQPRINITTAQIEQLRTEIRECQVPSEEWTRHRTALAHQQEHAERMRRELSDAEAARERLRRIESAWPTLCAWKSCQVEVDAVRDAILLPEDAEQRRTEAYRQLSLADSTLQQTRQSIALLNQQLDAIEVPTQLLSEHARIDELYKRLGSHEKGAEDRATLEARRRTARNHAKKTIEKLGWSTSVDDVSERRLTDANKALIRRLSARHGELGQRLRAAEQTRLRTAKRIERMEQQLAEAPRIGEPTQLAATLLAAAAAVNVAEQLDSQRRAVDALRQEADNALARLPLFDGTLEQAIRLKVPPAAAIEHVAEQQRALATQLESFQQRSQEYEAQQDDLREQLATLEKGDVVPTEQELRQTRNLRDSGIRYAVALLRGEPVESQALAKFLDAVDQGDELAEALEPTVRQADLVADRLRREADRVAEKTQLNSNLAALGAKAARLDRQIEEAQKAGQQLLADWTARWRETDLAPASPREMRAWIDQHAELIEIARNLASQSTTLDADLSRCDALREKLAQQLAECGLAPSNDVLSLPLLVKQGQEFLDQLQHDRALHKQLEKELARAQEEAEWATDEQRSASDDLTRWRNDWAEALTPLGLSPDVEPEEAEATLASVEHLFQQIDEADSFRDRVWGIDKTAEEFAEAAREMAAWAAPDLIDRPAEELVAELNRRAVEARRLDQEAKTLVEQRTEYERVERNAAVSAREAHAVLDSLLAEAGVEEIDALPRAIEKSNQRRQRERRLEELRQQLHPHCAGQSLADFYDDAGSEDPDRLASDAAAASERVKQLRNEFEDAVKAEQNAASAFQRYDGSAAAAEKADQRQGLLAELEEDARDYVVTRVAGSLLQRAIERYQQRSQGPVLSLASAQFEQLTGGAFAGLRPDYDDGGNDVLVGIRQENRSSVHVDQMSEGTRDQLYLAMRLATLEHWLGDHEPIPFIVDDILLSFDDARAEAALTTLLDLSGRTQVLFFTHHDHLVALAKSVSDSQNRHAAIHFVNEPAVAALG